MRRQLDRDVFALAVPALSALAGLIVVRALTNGTRFLGSRLALTGAPA